MENNLIDKAIVKVKSLKADLPNIAIILGSGLGDFIHWVDNPTFVNFEEISIWVALSTALFIFVIAFI